MEGDSEAIMNWCSSRARRGRRLHHQSRGRTLLWPALGCFVELGFPSRSIQVLAKLPFYYTRGCCASVTVNFSELGRTWIRRLLTFPPLFRANHAGRPQWPSLLRAAWGTSDSGVRPRQGVKSMLGSKRPEFRFQVSQLEWEQIS